MSAERERLLDLLVVRAFLRAADERLSVAVIISEIESDGRSHLFEKHLDYAEHLERFALMVARGAVKIESRSKVFN